MAREIRNTDDVIDSRDVIARLEELRDERQGLVDALNDWGNADELNALELALMGGLEVDPDRLQELRDEKQALEDAIQEWDDDNADDLKALSDLDEESPGDDWPHGATLIREGYFEEYCQQLVEDIGDLPKNIPHYIVIDWEATANNLRADYTTVEFGGETYLVR